MQDGTIPIEVCTTVSPDGASAILSLRGELDIATAPSVRAATLTEIRAGRHVTVDLGGLSFMDAAGLSVLVGAHKAAVRGNCSLRIVNASAPPIALVISVTGAERVLPIE